MIDKDGYYITMIQKINKPSKYMKKVIGIAKVLSSDIENENFTPASLIAIAKVATDISLLNRSCSKKLCYRFMY